MAGFLLKRFDKPTPIPDFHKTWWDLCCSDRRFVAFAAPRAHAKSTAITHSYVLANALFRVKDFIVIVSDTETQAIQFLNDIKMELTDNVDLKALFDIDKFVKFTENDIIVQFVDGRRFRILAKGSEQSLRGLKWNSKRPNLIVCDDMENDELVMNKERREKFMRWIYGALIPALSTDGQMRVVGTVLHLDSFLESLMPKAWDKKTVRTELYDYSTDDGKMWQSRRYRAHNSNFNEILWKSRYDRTYFIEKQRDYVDRGIPDVYSQEYLNYPMDPTRAYFKTKDFLEMSEGIKKDILEARLPLNYYVGIDPAISEHERADYTAIIVAGVDSENKVYVVDFVRDRIDAKEQIDWIFNLQAKYKPVFIAIEKEKITKALGPFLRDEMFRRNSFPYIIEIQPSKDLDLRARSWQGRMRAGGIRFDKDHEGYPQYEAELTTYPRGIKNDYVAASAVLGMALDKMVEAPSREEQQELEWQEEYKRTIDQSNNGRSLETGY